MKNQVLLTIIFLLSNYSIFGNSPNTEDFSNSGITSRYVQVPFWQNLTQDELLTLSPRKIKEKTGQKLSFKEKIALNVARKVNKRALKADRSDLPMDKTSVASMIFSLLGFLVLISPLIFWVFSLIGFALGVVALSRKGNYKNKRGMGFAIGGLILGGLILSLYLVALI